MPENPERRQMTELELKALVAQQIKTAETDDDTGDKRADLMDRYNGEPYGDEQENRSKVVSTDVADTIEWIMPELMDIFASGDKVVNFDPVGPEDEQGASQETDVVNHVMLKENDGFLIMHNWFKDALIQKNGYVKRWFDESEIKTVEEYANLDETDLGQLFEDFQRKNAKVEVLERIETEDGLIAGVKLEITTKADREVIESVPPEEMVIASRHNSIFLDDASFVAHKTQKTVSDLIEQGFDEAQVERLNDSQDTEFGEEKDRRFVTRDLSEDDEAERAGKAMREVTVYECYMRVDFDGDGIAELRKITVGGSGHEILIRDGEPDNEEVDHIPFSCISAVLMPHRHVGRSVAELVDDLQRIKTVLLRQMLDNIYLNNNARTEIAEDGIDPENTIADILNPRPGGIIRTRKSGNMREIVPTQLVGKMLPVLEFIENTRESRTGVTRFQQGLDPNTLNKTASGINQIMTAAQKKIRMIARVFAETGVKHLFRGIHMDLSKHSSRPKALRLRNEWIDIDPREWKTRSDMTVNVGLGTGNKEVMLGHLNNILTQQKEAMAVPELGLVTPKNLFNTMEKIVENAGLKSVDIFFTDPDTVQPAPQQPDEQQEAAQALAQIELAKIAQRQQEADDKRKTELIKMQLEDDRERDKFELQAVVEAMKAGVTLTLAEIKTITDAPRQQAQLNLNQGIAEIDQNRQQIVTNGTLQ
jgi:hypothetical protein